MARNATHLSIFLSIVECANSKGSEREQQKDNTATVRREIPSLFSLHCARMMMMARKIRSTPALKPENEDATGFALKESHLKRGLGINLDTCCQAYSVFVIPLFEILPCR